jgi:tetratricopeptide (TPR) repeat protein
MQLISAWEFGLRLRQRNEDAHLRLYQLYLQMQYFDMALDHLGEALRVAQADKPATLDEQEAASKRLEQMQKSYNDLDTQVTRQRNEFELSATGQPLAAKVQLAKSKGLGKKALDLLLEADPAQMDAAAASMQLDLLLTTGQPDVVRTRLNEVPELKEYMGVNYDLLNVFLGAALGDYRQACEYLDEAINKMERDNTQRMLLVVQAQTFQGVSPLSLSSMSVAINRIKQLAEFRVMRGMLALEEGDTATAAKQFQQALDMGDGKEFQFDSRAVAMRYLELLKAARKND